MQYLDVKPDNILLDIEDAHNGSTPRVSHVQIADLETASAPPPGMSIKGPLLGNHMWRSPEAHVRAKMHTPSDVFSFGIVVCGNMSYIPDSLPSYFCTMLTR